MELRPIGVIHTPFTQRKGTPIQPAAGRDVTGTVVVDDEYRAGLRDLDGFSHVVLVYAFHRSRGFDLEVVPFLDTVTRGLFATRAPRRPNPLGISVVRLDRIENGTLHVRDLDILDGTPLLDIKPHVPRFDDQAEVRTGWLEDARRPMETERADGRFED
jgi:tRNA-Thr(GGU) m(6)t(6)A37 methyltransferase TsaA